MSYRLCWLLASGISSILTLLANSQHNVYDIYLLLCVQKYTPDDAQKTCLKHVELYSKNKFEKSVHLVGLLQEYITMHGPLNVKVRILMSPYTCTKEENPLCLGASAVPGRIMTAHTKHGEAHLTSRV